MAQTVLMLLLSLLSVFPMVLMLMLLLLLSKLLWLFLLLWVLFLFSSMLFLLTLLLHCGIVAGVAVWKSHVASPAASKSHSYELLQCLYLSIRVYSFYTYTKHQQQQQSRGVCAK